MYVQYTATAYLHCSSSNVSEILSAASPHRLATLVQMEGGVGVQTAKYRGHPSKYVTSAAGLLIITRGNPPNLGKMVNFTTLPYNGEEREE